jgi:ABC-type antimicrobial peptide transport system permease subunit
MKIMLPSTTAWYPPRPGSQDDKHQNPQGSRQFRLEVVAASGWVHAPHRYALGCRTGCIFRTPVAHALAPVAIASTCAVATGLVFGFPPIMKTARLDPAVALTSD